ARRLCVLSVHSPHSRRHRRDVPGRRREDVREAPARSAAGAAVHSRPACRAGRLQAVPALRPAPAAAGAEPRAAGAARRHGLLPLRPLHQHQAADAGAAAVARGALIAERPELGPQCPHLRWQRRSCWWCKQCSNHTHAHAHFLQCIDPPTAPAGSAAISTASPAASSATAAICSILCFCSIFCFGCSTTITVTAATTTATTTITTVATTAACPSRQPRRAAED
ncbi:hypothetical protein GQ42DRAFT_47714, partial [Ramicandelaber brevisporus]